MTVSNLCKSLVPETQVVLFSRTGEVLAVKTAGQIAESRKLNKVIDWDFRGDIKSIWIERNIKG